MVLLVLSATGTLMAKELVDYIDPMIGCSTQREGKSHGLGKTFPGSVTPFGLVQLSPDTATGGDNGPRYSYHHESIEGFRFVHMSGIGWFGDLGNFLVTPFHRRSPANSTSTPNSANRSKHSESGNGIRSSRGSAPTREPTADSMWSFHPLKTNRCG